MIALTAEQMREADERASKRVGETTLMENAGKAIAALIRRLVPDGGRIVAFAGPGNNGGDAYAAFAELDDLYTCVVYASQSGNKSEARVRAERRAHRRRIIEAPLATDEDSARAALEGCQLALDALFGTGSRIPAGPEFVPAIRALNATSAPVLAIDLPTGVDAGSGARGDDAVLATHTIALGALKSGLVLEPARENVGTLWLADIGITHDELHGGTIEFAALDDRAFLELLPKRAPGADKRSAGAPLIIAGSVQFPGAAVLCARGAARAGAGYVTVATGAAAAPQLRAHLVEQVVVALDDDASPDNVASQLLEIAGHNSSVGIGPGLGLDDRTGALVRAFARQCTLPMVIDASALFHFAKQLDILKEKPCVITPHAGEFARLSGKGTIKDGERVARLREFVDRTHVTTLLKGETTLVYDGTVVHLNTTGTPALATAGTGDVLTGMIATLLSQGLKPVDAARAAAYWHGLAGRACASHRRIGVVAGDIPESLAAALPHENAKSASEETLSLVFSA